MPSVQITACMIALCALWVPPLAGASAAEDIPPFEYGEISGVFETPGEKDGYLSFGALDQAHKSYAAWKAQLADNHGVSFMVEDRLISQHGNGARILDNELNIVARGEMLRGLPGTLSWNIWGQFAKSVGSTTASQFQQDLGILSPLNGGNGGPDTSIQILQMLVLEYINPDNRWRAQAGKLALRTLVNLNRYANGDSEMFFSPMLGNNPVVPYTAQLGLGVFGQWKEDTWWFSALVRAPDAELGLSTGAWQSGHREYVVEAALTPTISGIGYGEYRLTWSLDEATQEQPQIKTWSLSADQDFGDRIGGFFRYAWADNTFRAFEQRAAAGFQLKKPLGFTHDRLGSGVWWGDPSDETLNDERGLEVFYKATLSPFVELTPDLQIVFDPANSDAAREVIVGVRLRIAL